MKKGLFIFMLLFLLIGLVSCSDKNEDIKDDEEEKIETPEDKEDPKEEKKGSLYIRYNQNNDKNAVLDKVNDLDNYVLITPKKEGYDFDGWFSDEDLNYIFKLSDLSLPTDENDIIIDVYADWSIQKFTVDFMDDGEIILSRTVAYGGSAREPRDTFKSGYRFIGWDKDFSYVTSDMVVNAIYEKNNGSKNIMVVLGNWMNDNGTISSTMRLRLELALDAFSEFDFDYIVVTGGMANSKAGISEAQAMYNYLVEHGIDSNISRREEAEKQFSIKTYESLSEALKNNNYNAAVISTSPLSHSKIITECLNNKLNVFTEINLVSDDYDKNIKLSKDKNLSLFISSTPMYRKEMQYIKEFAKTHTKGIYHYHIGQYLPEWHPWESYQKFFVGDKRTNGCRELFAIELPWLIDAFGDVIEFKSIHNKFSNLELAYDDTYSVNLIHSSGIIGNISIDIITPKAGREFELWGEKYYIEWKGTPDSLAEFNIEKKELAKVNLYNNFVHDDNYNKFVIEDAYYEELLNFLNSIEKKMNPLYSFEKDKKILSLIDKIEGL